MPRWPGIILVGTLLAACSGGSSSVLPKSGGATPAKAKVHVSITMRVPGAASARNAALKRRFLIAQNTAGALVSVYTAGNDNGTPLATTAANIEPSTSPGSTCTASDPLGNRSCTFDILAPPGTDDFVITTWDQAPNAGGTIPAGASELGWGLVPAQSIVAGTTTPIISATLSSVLASVSLDLTPAALHEIIPTTGTIGVYVLDADNDVIVSNGFVDPYGNPITLSFNVDNNLNGALYFSPSSISAPSPTGVQYVYAPGNGVLAQSANVTSNISVSSSAAGVTATGAALQAIYPTFNSVADFNLTIYNSYHGGIAFDGLGGVYYTTTSGFGGVSYYSGTGATSSPIYSGTASNPVRGGLVGGTVAGNPSLLSVTGSQELLGTLNGASTTMALTGPTTQPLPNGGAIAASTSAGITTLWYAAGPVLVSLNTQTFAATTYSSFPDAPAAGVTVDTSGNVWIVDSVNDQLYEFPFGSSSLGLPPVPLQAGGQPFDVLVNANGEFVTDHGPNPAIIQLNSGSIVNILSVPGGATPWSMMPDNAQPGIVWFDYLLNGQIGIGRMDTNTNPATFVMATDNTAPSGSQAGAIGAASNGLVYMVFEGTRLLVQVLR
jgi:hypothetical protein